MRSRSGNVSLPTLSLTDGAWRRGPDLRDGHPTLRRRAALSGRILDIHDVDTVMLIPAARLTRGSRPLFGEACDPLVRDDETKPLLRTFVSCTLLRNARRQDPLCNGSRRGCALKLSLKTEIVTGQGPGDSCQCARLAGFVDSPADAREALLCALT